MTPQPGILLPPPRMARYLTFSLTPGASAKASLQTLSNLVDGEEIVAGLGQSLVETFGVHIRGLHTFPAQVGPGIEIPSTPAALWIWLRGEDRGELLHRTRSIQQALAPTFRLEQVIDAFQYEDSRDLTGYEDGTENPEGDEALKAALVSGQGEGYDGASFVAVQQWVHDLDAFQAKPASEQDNIIGRRKSDNEELEDAPESAHVKRTAQEDFVPEAFVLRRSMPWTCGMESGLVFVAFGRSFDAFEAQLIRMVGAEDGITDAVFTFTRPISGSYFWCPPIRDGHLDLSALDV
ncbi:MAG TPA: Dyp-type peroxidase [Caldilineae bacterium]|nr:Dyp-type peroxidase [Caldilineae bacterium]